jgi:glycine hydroxymethyltransferase
MEQRFREKGIKMVSDGTDTHLLLLDVSDFTDGSKLETVLEQIQIAANKNTIPGDTSALKPHGLRIGTPAMTTRGLSADGFRDVVDLIVESMRVCQSMGKVKNKEVVSKLDATWVQDMRQRVLDLTKGLLVIE